MKISFVKIIFVLVFGFICLTPFMASASSTDNMSGYAMVGIYGKPNNTDKQITAISCCK